MDGQKRLNISKGLGIAIFLAFCLQLPSLFEPYRYGDEGIYLTLGLGLRQGLVLYRDIYDNKPPLIYLVAALVGNQFWFRYFLLFWHLINVWLIFILAKKIFKNELSAFAAALFFTIFSVTQEGNIANGEIFMIMPTTAAMLFLISKFKTKNYFLIGVLFSLGFLFKVPAGFTFLAAFTFLIFKTPKLKLTSAKLKNFFFLITGFSFLPLLTVVYYWWQRALAIYLKAIFFQNLGYLSAWAGEWQKPLFSLSSGFSHRGIILTLILILIFLTRQHLAKHFLFLILWFFFDLFAALLSGRPYPHYLLQVGPALSLLIIWFFKGRKILEKVWIMGAIFLLIFAFWHYQFWSYPVWPYYQNFYQFLTGQKSKEAYFAFFGEQVNELYQVAKIIKSLSYPYENIFIWGDEPCLYIMSERLPPGRYTVAYHVVDFKGWQETLLALKENQPRLIVKIKNSPNFEELDEFIKLDYFKVTELARTTIFLKKG